jgi:hypothetical protein
MLDLAKTLGLDDGEVDYPGAHRSNARRDRQDVDDWVVTASYQYEAKGTVFTKLRQESSAKHVKTYRWEPKLSDSGVSLSDMPLFGIETLRNGEPVLFVEGEEVARACWDKGLPAVTCPGGAGQRSFGDALSVLHNMDVWLWPDNDDEGRMLMSTLNALLKPIAASLHMVAVPVPPKGDAKDFFAAGGKVEAVWASDTTVPKVDIVEADHLVAMVPSDQGTVVFEFADMLRTPRALEAEVTVRINGYADEFHWAGNTLPPSARTGLARDLRSYFNGQADLNWARAVNIGFHSAVTAHSHVDPSVETFTLVDPGDPGYLVPSLLPRNQTTVWFSMGGVAKTYCAQATAALLSLGKVFPGYLSNDYTPDKGGTLYLDYETCADGGATFRRRMNRIAAGLGRDSLWGVRYWPGRGIPLHDQIGAIGKAIRDHGISLFIIDSALGACGGSPEDATTVSRFFADLQRLPPVTVLVISHITKPKRDRDGNVVPEATEYPFGSIHWHNQARATWYLEGTRLTADAKGINFIPRKANDGPWPPEKSYVLDFEGWTGPVQLLSDYDWRVTHGNGYAARPAD